MCDGDRGGQQIEVRPLGQIHRGQPQPAVPVDVGPVAVHEDEREHETEMERHDDAHVDVQRQVVVQGGGNPPEQAPMLHRLAPLALAQQLVDAQEEERPIQDYSDLRSLSAVLTQRQVNITDNDAFFRSHPTTMEKSQGLFKGLKESRKEKQVKSLQTQVVKDIIATNGPLIEKVNSFSVSFNKLKDKLDADAILPLREKDARLVRFMLPFSEDINTLNGIFADHPGSSVESISLNIARFYHEFMFIKRRIDLASVPGNHVDDYESDEEIKKAQTLQRAKNQASTFLKRDEVVKSDKVEQPLNEGQKNDLKDLDQWLVSHAHDSGSPFEKLVNTLLQKTDRERFFVFYLIAENREEIGNAMDCFSCYYSRVSVEKFEKAMSSSFKIFRTKAGAYRWEKIEKAIQTGLGLALPLSVVSGLVMDDTDDILDEKLQTELEGIHAKKEAEIQQINAHADWTEEQRQTEREQAKGRYEVEAAGLALMASARMLINDLSALNPNRDDQEFVDRTQEKITKFLHKLQEYQRATGDYKDSSMSKTVKAEGLFSKVTGLGSVGTGIATAGTMTQVSNNIAEALSNEDYKAVTIALAPLLDKSTFWTAWSMSGLSVLSGLAGLTAGVGMTIGAFKTMMSDDWSDSFAKFMSAGATLAGALKSLASGVKTGSLMHLTFGVSEKGLQTMNVLGKAVTGLGYAKAGLDFLSMGANSISVIKRGHNISSATQKLQQQRGGFDVEHDQSEEAKLLRLSKNIKKKKTCDAIVSGVNLAFSVTSVCPIGLLASLCVTGAGMITTFALDKLLGSKFGAGAIKEKAINDIFDPVALFGQDTVAHMKPKELSKMISEYATEAAASMGMSKDRLFNAIICCHADNIYQKLFFNNQGRFDVDPRGLTDDQLIYADIARSYGCSVRFSSELVKCKPTKETLISKMMKI